MSILVIAKNIVLQNFRKKRSFVFMTLLPLILIVILGVSFSGWFGHNSTIDMGDINLRYYTEGDETDLTNNFLVVMNESLTNDSEISIIEKNEGLDLLKDNKIDCLIEIDENNSEILLYKNPQTGGKTVQISLIETVLKTYVSRYNTIVKMYEIDPSNASNIINSNNSFDYVTIEGFEKEDSPSALDYYGIAMCLLFVLYGITTPMMDIINDKKNGLIDRIIVSPTSKAKMFVGQFLGYLILTICQLGIVYLVTRYLMNINWGVNPIYALILLFSGICMAISVGLFFGYTSKNERIASSVLHVFIIVTSFFGGGYLDLSSLGVLNKIGKWISIMWWNNKGLIMVIYSNEYSIYYRAIFLNITIGLVMFLCTVLYIGKKGVFINE